jgi:hypothetical protein
MMQALRNNTKITIAFVVVAFVGFMAFSILTDIGQAGDAPVNVVGKVNDRDIPLRDFSFRVNQIIDRQQQEEPDKEFTESDYRSARREAWNAFVQEKLQMQEIEKRGITLTDEELVQFLKYYPPEEAGMVEAFMTEGRFDYQKYLQAMADPAFQNLWIYLEQVSRPRFTTHKLAEYVGSMVRVSPNQVREEYIRDNERIKVRYGLIPLRSFDITEIEIDSQQVVDY